MRHSPWRLALPLLLATVLLRPPAAPAAAPDPFRKDPWLGCPAGPHAMPVRWQLATTAPCTLRWRRADDAAWLGATVTTETGPDHLHAHVISGLAPATRYTYRVSCDGAARAGVFRTWPSPSDTTLAFTVYGDTRSQPAAHDSVVAAILALLDEAADFRTVVISTGDLVAEGDREEQWEEQFFALPHLRRLLATVPLLSARGNHERSGRLFHRWFAYPDSGRGAWSCDVGPAHFVFVDQYRDYSPGSDQYRWLEHDLAGTDRPWKILVLHQPGWSAGGHHDTSAVQQYLQPLCVRYGVSLVLAGHNHYYARCSVDGVQHVTTGGGGAPLYTPNPDRPHVVTAAKAYHFCRVEIMGRELRFTAEDLDGRVLDAFVLRR